MEGLQCKSKNSIGKKKTFLRVFSNRKTFLNKNLFVKKMRWETTERLN